MRHAARPVPASPHDYARAPRHRFLAAAAALALATAPALAGDPVAGNQASGDHLTPEAYRMLAVEVLDKAISIPSVAGRDQTYPLAKYLADTLIAGGFRPEDVEVERHGDAATLVAFYRGATPEAPAPGPIVLSAHLDVVEAKPDDWERDPFKLVAEDGFYFGRGSIDNKFGVAMIVTTLIRLKAEGFTPNRDIIVAFSGDEETSMATTQILAERFKDADLVLNSDGGGGALGDDGLPLAYFLQGAEKTYADFTVTATNPGGHSSLPRPDNAIYDLAAAALRISEYVFPAQASDVTKAFFRMTGEQTGGKLGEAMIRFSNNPQDRSAVKTIAAYPEYVGQVRTTCVATLLDAGHAVNALPQRAEMNVNCRIFPGVSPESVRQTLVDVIDNPAITVSLRDEVNYADASPLREDVTAAVRKALDRRFPGTAIVPEMSAGASDSLHFRARGVDSYGVSGIFMKPADVFAHGLNERAPQASVDGALDHWRTLLTELAGGGESSDGDE